MHGLAIKRLLSIVLLALGWLFAGVRLALDVIGWSTAPDDVGVTLSRAERIFDWLLSVPAYFPFAVVLIATIYLIWSSWPRRVMESELSSSTTEDGNIDERVSALAFDLSGDSFELKLWGCKLTKDTSLSVRFSAKKTRSFYWSNYENVRIFSSLCEGRGGECKSIAPITPILAKEQEFSVDFHIKGFATTDAPLSFSVSTNGVKSDGRSVIESGHGGLLGDNAVIFEVLVLTSDGSPFFGHYKVIRNANRHSQPLLQPKIES